MPATPPIPEQVADDLRGTCRTLAEVLEWHDAVHIEDNADFCSGIDDLVFCCSECGWWCETSEMEDPDSWRCADCATGG